MYVVVYYGMELYILFYIICFVTDHEAQKYEAAVAFTTTQAF